MTSNPQNPFRGKKYGITERKKAELDALSNKVLEAQNDVNKLQTIVNSLQEKSTKLQTLLVVDEADKKATLANKESLDQILDYVLDLLMNSKVTFTKTIEADTKIREVSISIDNVINKLIYSAEVVNKLSNLVIRKKAQNPLISDELVNMVTTAGTDANNAVALTLKALESVFGAQATTIESESVLALELLQGVRLLKLMTSHDLATVKDKNTQEFIAKLQEFRRAIMHVRMEPSYTNVNNEQHVQALIYEAYFNASARYNRTLKASRSALEQLGEAENRLSKATIKLNSLESGLAAAKAAALAS